MNNDWEVLGFIFCGLTLILWAFVALKSYADSNRPRYDDRIPRRHRTITRNAFKTRIGAREYR